MLLQFGLLFCVVATQANPLFNRRNYDEEGMKVLYDQRQEGDWNIHADLKNFLFVIIPASAKTPVSNVSSGSSSNAIEQGLLYLLSKSGKTHGHHPHHQTAQADVTTTEKQQEETPSSSSSSSEENQETKHFIESKSAPYQVDISKNSGGLLSKLYPEITSKDGGLVAESPAISLLKDAVSGRIGRTLVLAVPSEDILITKTKKGLKKKARDDHLKKGEAGAGCGPGQVKDSYGNCKVMKY